MSRRGLLEFTAAVRVRSAAAGAALAAVVLVAGCSGGPSSSSSAAPPSAAAPVSSAGSAAASAGSAAVETNPPGDIPDSQAFVTFGGDGFAVRVPEGWARRTLPGGAEFSDKYNSVTAVASAAAVAPNAASVRADEVPQLRASQQDFQLREVSTVTRAAGPAVLVTYRALSPVNPVTGKVATQDVERYEFWRSGRVVALTLAAPVGADNVDPWRTVTDSFAWTR